MNFDREPNNRQVQMDDQAGRMKLTAVTIGHGHSRLQFFAMLRHDALGEAILPSTLLDQLLSKANVLRGTTLRIG